MNCPNGHAQQGFSLVELMVAMAVSLTLMLGITQILLGNKDSYRTQDNLAELNQNARFARFIVKNAIEHAGYLVDLNATPQFAFTNGFIDDSPNGFTTRYQSDGAMNNCLGSQVTENETAYFKLYVNSQNELQCRYDSNGDGQIDSDDSTEPLIDNVVLINIRFGLDSNPDDARAGVNQYIDQLTGDNRPNVRSVRVQLILRSRNKIATTAPPSFDIAGSETDYKPPDQKNSTGPYYAYQMVDQVVALRNLLP